MYHFIYKTTHDSGKYYVGRHSTKNIDDGYLGSGKWIRSIKDKSSLKREILKFCSEDELHIEETKIISENIGQLNCMNFNNSSIGFSSGELNPNKDPDRKKILRERILGEKNPAKRIDVRKKMSESQKGKIRSKWTMSDEGKRNISESRKGLKISDEGRKKLSESRLKDYANGVRKPHNKSGWKHSEESKKNQSILAKQRPKYKCIHCNKEVDLGNLNRWHNNKCKLGY